MKSINVNSFFSCSFADGDKDINSFFYAICQGLDIRSANVDTAFSTTPPESAKKMLSEVQALVAVCTKRSKLEQGGYVMPAAVHDELSFAFGKSIPILMFVEQGVELAGFKDNFGTHLRFNRAHLYEADFLRKAVAALHNLKMEVVSHDDVLVGQSTGEFYSEFTRHLFEMRELDKDFIWSYSCSKKLVFSKPYKRAFPTGVWTTQACKVPANAEKIRWELEAQVCSKSFEITTVIEKHTPECMEGFIRIEPSPGTGDFVEYSTLAESRYLNAVWEEEIAEEHSTVLHLSAGDFKCFDGLIPIQSTKKASLVFRFPRSYGLKPSDVVPFVGSYTSGVDYEVDSELHRSTIEVQSYGGALEIRFDIESPLLRHVYGVAWNPKSKEKWSGRP